MKLLLNVLGLTLLILVAEARPQEPEAGEEAAAPAAPLPPKRNLRQGCPQLEDKINPKCEGKNANCKPCIDRLLKCPTFSKDEAPTECLQKVVCFDTLIGNDETFFDFCTKKQITPLEE